MKLYTGIDLHSNNNYLAIIDDNDNRVFKRKLPNHPETILATLGPFRCANLKLTSKMGLC
jgi:transposase